MPNPYFKFKQFTVFHDKCAMKVGTDGVLLGAWAAMENAVRILDVGTGSGLIALMAAQRNPGARIVAIDIDHDAVDQASENIRNSPFASRIAVEEKSLEDFVSHGGKLFDSIVCNPPFFENSLKSPVSQRSVARHDETLTLENLLSCAKKLISPIGRISLVLPADRWGKVDPVCARLSLHVVRKTWVRPLAGRPPKRILFEMSPRWQTTEENDMAIEISRHCYTPEYVELTHDFYIRM